TTTASRQGEKATASCDQTRQSRTDDGARDGHGLAGERKARVERWRRVAAHDIGAHPQPVGLQSFISYPGLKIGEAGREGRSGWHDGQGCREPQESVPGR